MDFLKITDILQGELEPKITKMFPNREYSFELNHRHTNRFVQLQTSVNDDSDIHFEYYQGYVELHLEGKYSGYEYNPLWRNLVNKSNNDEHLSWHRWSDRNQGRCRYIKKAETSKDIIEGFTYLSKIFDPILSESKNDNNSHVYNLTSEIIDLPEADIMKVDKLTHKIFSIKDLPFDNLIIPEYQRPYKWSAKNVNQLITDLLTFRKSKEYRLGTLVLNDNNIVDGQQRIITLSILLYALFAKEEIIKDCPFPEVQDKVKIFWQRTKFKNEHSIAHVRENLAAIKDRLEDFDSEFLEFLLQNCQFVVVRLPKISEAFQFFDSQNARGKDLEPHDLLKAFHLREIKKMTDRDNLNITAWQEQKTDRLKDLFLSMFRVKKWARKTSAKDFAKNDIDSFKGISLDKERYPFYMQQIICHYFSNVYSNDIIRSVDKSEMEYPFQLEQMCVNGSRFFDMVRHYNVLYSQLLDSSIFKTYDNDKDEKTAYKIIKFLSSYSNRNRTGDMYVRQLFNCLLMYYVDKYGFEEINKVVKKLFRYVYRLRLTHFSVQLSTINNDAIQGQLFGVIRDSMSPFDIINVQIQIPTKEENARNADTELQTFYY